MLPKTKIHCPECSKDIQVIPGKTKKGSLVKCPNCGVMVKFKSDVMKDMDKAAEGFADGLKKMFSKYNK